MIRVTIEMVTQGDDSRTRILAQGVIVNDQSGGTGPVGNYDFGLTKQIPKSGRDPGLWRTGKVKGFRRHEKNVWHLLKLCLEEATR